jgi:hypothetical protein
MNTSGLETLVYASRYAWVDFKRLVKIPLKSDKAHLRERIVRAAAQEQIHPDTAFTSGVRPDGLGAMILQRLSIQAAAKAMGFDYYHTPFGFVGHPETDPETWSRVCEAEFDLGFGFPDASQCNLPYMEFTDYAVDRKAWRKPHLVGFREMFRYCNQRPEIYTELDWPRHYRSTVVERPRETKRLAVHVRRGDVNLRTTSGRYSSNEAVLRAVDSVTARLDAHRINYQVEIHSNGTPEELADFRDRGFTVCDSLGALETFRQLVSADVLMMAKSTFSYVAGLCSPRLVVYQPQDYVKLERWVALSRDGQADPGQISDRLSRLGW